MPPANRFAAWIADRSEGLRRGRDYLFRPVPGTLNSVTEEFTYFEDNGRNYRWFEFDDGEGVPFARNGWQNGTLSGGVLDGTVSCMGSWATPEMRADVSASTP